MIHTTKLLAIAAAILASAETGWAQDHSELPDQQNDPASTRSFSCGTPPILNGTLLQSFVPTLPTLTAVELRLRAGTAFPASGVATTIRIRTTATDSEVLAESTAHVSGPRVAGSQFLLRFDLEPLAVTPGTTLAIEWVTPNSNELTWVGAAGDPYADGTAFSCIGNVWPGGATDFNFATFGLPAAEPSVKDKLIALHDATVTATTLRGKRCLRRLVVLACRCVERGKLKAARIKLRVFQWKVHTFVCFGWLEESVGRALIKDAKEIRAELCVANSQRRARRHRS